jgi:hypothetical protein
MAIKELAKRETTRIDIDLTGPDGNAFALISLAKRYASQLRLDGEAIVAEMTSGDYESLIQVFDKHFGEYVDLYR